MHRKRRDRARAILRKRRRIHDAVCKALAYASALCVVMLAMLPASPSFNFQKLPGYAVAIALPMGYLFAYIYANGEQYRARKEREQLRKMLGKVE